jgi:F-type H+-transporting ATPase subunit b
MNLLAPSEGLVFWTGLVFIILLILLRKFAWKPILGAVNAREGNIQKALDAAKEAEASMKALTAQNESLLAEARDERDKIIKEAKAAKEEMISSAKEKANQEASKILSDAIEQITVQKQKAITELKNQVATISIDIAERILKSELSEKSKQEFVINTIVEDINLN